MVMCFDMLNEQSPHIKFTRENPKDKWLPILNVLVHLSRGEYNNRWYRKPTNETHQFIAPLHIRLKLDRYRQEHDSHSQNGLFGDQQLTISVDHTHKIAVSNGYPNMRHSWNRSIRMLDAYRQRNGSDKIPFLLQYLSDELSSAIQTCLRKFNL